MSNPLSLHDAGGIIADIPGRGVVLAVGDSVPADASLGYATGCLFIHIDGGDGSALYVNEGTNSSADFNAIDGA